MFVNIDQYPYFTSVWLSVIISAFYVYFAHKIAAQTEELKIVTYAKIMLYVHDINVLLFSGAFC
jgi:hypothetical protein